MKILTSIVLALMLFGCATVTPPPAPTAAPVHVTAPPAYTTNEATRLMLCMSMADNAMTIATYKVAGKSIDEVKALYRQGPQSTLTLALVDKVYGENISHTWDYTVSFYEECAVNMANIPPPRSDMATYCMQNVLIASTAYNLKAAGLPKETTYKRFDKMGETPKHIVDEVYGQSGTRTEVTLKTWNSCMAPLTANY